MLSGGLAHPRHRNGDLDLRLRRIVGREQVGNDRHTGPDRGPRALPHKGMHRRQFRPGFPDPHHDAAIQRHQADRDTAQPG